MFDKKRTNLVGSGKNVAVATPSNKNAFLSGVAKESARTISGNGANRFNTTGDLFVDQFGGTSNYLSPRNYRDISNDCAALWALDQETFVKFTIYLRMISRKTNIIGHGITTEAPQSGAELKHESIMRMVWLSQKAPDIFWENIGLFISAGSVKDIFVMLRNDLVYHGWDDRKLNWNKFGDLILSLLNDDRTVNLVKKYLPQIRNNKSCTTVEAQANNMIAKWVCSLVFGSKEGSKTYKQYRQLKNSGNAHQWQQLISKRNFTELDFGKIHGRALNLLVKSKFLKNQDLQTQYSEWIGDQTKVKYTGFVHELLCELDLNTEENFVKTVDKQFVEAVEKVKEDRENLTSMIVVRDTSGSMGSNAGDSKFSCGNVAKALALYFAEFLDGQFAGHWIEFNSGALMHQWKGETASERWYNDRSGYLGNTNFQSVIQLFAKMKGQGVPEQDFPQGILCISDYEFNPGQLGKTNVETALDTLRGAGFSEDYVSNFRIVLWNLTNNYYGRKNEGKFETYGSDVPNVFYLSGYSASTVKFVLTESVASARDLFNEAMDQELLNLVKV